MNVLKPVTLGALLLVAAHSAMAQPVDRYRRAAEQLVQLLNTNDHAGVHKLFSPEMAEALPEEKARAFFSGLRASHGRIERLGEERREGQWRVFPAEFERGKLDLKLVLDRSNRISGLFLGPAKPARQAPARNATTLSLPFKGKWLVFWGGDTRDVNYHHDTPNQKFALDLLGVGPDGKTRRGDGKRNEDYYAFGREVLAPGDGVVVEAIDGVRDNTPGSLNPYSVVGNCVIIKHRDDEYSVLAHFKQGTVRVKAGDQVKRGEVLGLCGNSGNSSEPHIHYHVQHDPWLQDGLGVKAQFDRVRVHREGNEPELRKDYAPVKGEVISPE